MRILTVFGTRPEAIKMAPVVRELRRRKELDALVCVTAQHREMLDQILNCFSIAPDYDLDLMRQGQSLSAFTSAAFTGVARVIGQAKPDMVLVHGDTSSSLAGALAAFYGKIPLGHVEAGLRSHDRHSPFPEEMNRQLIDRLSDLLFAPTAESRENLLRENLAADRIWVTGNTAIDAMKTTLSLPCPPDVSVHIHSGERLILLTAHRRENLGEPLRRIFRAARRLAESFSDLRIVCPVHRNPLVRRAAHELLSGCPRIELIEPLDTVSFHHLLRHAVLVLTDSGGIQEEAPALGKPVLVLRETTERPEGVAAGTLLLVGTEEETIVRETSRLLTDDDACRRMSRAVNPYGDGHASERIADAIIIYGKEKAP